VLLIAIFRQAPHFFLVGQMADQFHLPELNGLQANYQFERIGYSS
jgi:hypothetical protein